MSISSTSVQSAFGLENLSVILSLSLVTGPHGEDLFGRSRGVWRPSLVGTGTSDESMLIAFADV